MPRVSIIVAGLVALAAPAGAQRAASFAGPVKKFIVADQPVVLVRDARLWDGTGASAKPGQDMLVRDGRIVAIGAGLATPAGAKVIDVAGKTLMPGLVMMHEHLFREVPGLPTTFYSDPYVPQIMLAYGTTTARTGGSFDMEGDVAIKNAIIAGKAPGPEIDLTLFVNGPEPFFTLPGLVDGDSVRRHIAYWNGRGATSIKLWFNTTPAIAEVAIDEARRRGMTVAAHLCATFAATAAAMGINTLEHSMLAAYDIVPGAKEGDCPARERQPAMILNMAKLDAEGPEVGGVLSQLLAHGVAITPTISVRDEHLCAPKETPPARELAMLAKFEPGTGLACFTGINHAVDLKSVAFQAATAVRYHRMGGTLVMGTDMGLVPGAMGPEELERMVAAGLTPAEVLVAATRNGAVALKRAKDIGTLEVGKRADFLLVDGKPDETISDIRKLTHVARDGVVYDPSKLYEDARGKLR